MAVTFFLPFKGLQAAKSRWPDLGPRKRDILLCILERNLRVVAQVVGARNTHLVTPDPEVLKLFPEYGQIRVEGAGLNPDLRQARAGVRGALAVLLPDLPYLEVADVEALVASCEAFQVTICTDLEEQGTNALALNPGQIMDFRFEGNSRAKHQELATTLGLSVQVLRRPGLARDCDRLEDLKELTL